MKQTPLARKSPMRAARRRAPAAATHTSSPAMFHAYALSQRVCAACGRAGDMHAHHVVSRRELRVRGLEQYRPENALRLCPVCHFNHEYGGAGRKLRLTMLSDENIAYAFEVLGDAALVYLPRHYSGTDPRVPV